ncbi:hypothetical protein GPJ56_005084 [Histomonas meleagridis]|uniref:uncharacterized protein n=1 Tax=Histomonas meleagridis TaxID=135588 RepID=UPI00355AAE97|nr:hypothetical protein GPJ56_005084 [Histomonas meleagridis]KAH0802601.1 hypothetical protein GO595_004650 [Histomonas meleagridis]
MEDNRSLRMEAQALFNDEHYTEACDAYRELLKNFDKDFPFSLDMAIDFTNYGRCLILSTDFEDVDEDNLDSILEEAKIVLTNAVTVYENIDQDGSFEGDLIEVHEYLADVESRRNNIKESQNEYKKAYEIGLNNSNIPWKTVATDMFNYANEFLTQYNQSMDNIINFLDQRLQTAEKEEDKQQMNEFKAKIVSLKSELNK